HEHRHRLARAAVAGVPADLEAAEIDIAELAREARDVILQHGDGLAAALAAHHIAGGNHLAQILDHGPEERLAAGHDLEAVVGRRVVRAGHHDPAVGVELVDREI